VTRLGLVSEHDVRAWEAAHSRGTRPSRWPYGADALTDHGWSVRPLPPPTRKPSKAQQLLEHRLGMPIVRGAKLSLEPVDGLICLLEQDAIACATVRPRRPTATFACWAAERSLHATPKHRRTLRNRLARIDLIMVWSANQVPILVDLGLDRDAVLAVPYGVDADFYRPEAVQPSTDIDVLAVGQDHGRDYATLLQAVANRPYNVQIVCGSANLAGLQIPDNVAIHAPVDHVAYRDLVRRASVVVVPTHTLAYPTGQSVALESMAVGRAVVATGTEPMREYLTHNVNSLLCEPGDPEDLRHQIERALADADLRRRLGDQGRQSVVDRFTTQHMWAAAFPHLERVFG